MNSVFQYSLSIKVADMKGSGNLCMYEATYLFYGNLEIFLLMCVTTTNL